MAEWLGQLQRVAGSPNTVAKVSGLRRTGQPYTVEALRPVWEAALELFGPGRLMFGSDWPMTVPDGGYRPTFDVLAALVGELPVEDQRMVMGGTARRVYRLE
jgi:L-fuconolactonase